MIDWQMLILQLRSHGETYERIGESVGVASSTVSCYCNYGSEPRYSKGVRLIAYAKRVLSDEDLKRCNL